MILQHGNDAVGEWVFWDPVGERARVDALAWALESARAVLNVLDDARLLVPDTAIVVFAPSEGRGPFRRPLAAGDPIGHLRQMLQDEWAGSVPVSLWIEGSGTLLSPAGETLVRDVVSISASEVAHHGRVLVATRCDAWLPYDLRGHPQAETSGLNAPRLRGALERIEHTLGVHGECRRSEITQCDGYTVTNRFDVDGEPLDIFDLGYDESRVASS